MAYKQSFICCLVGAVVCFSSSVTAGPYGPAAGESGSTAIHKDDDAFVAWATGWENYAPGTHVDAVFQTPDKALGEAAGTSFDVVSLGRGGEITLTFDPPIQDGAGWDFAVFENGVTDSFLELAFVEVSSDGVQFARFDNDSLTAEPVGGFGALDPTDITGFAGKYRQGYGTPFDLAELSGRDDAVDLSRVTHIRIIDIVGDDSALDTSGDVIYDPYPTVNSAGFDLDAVGVSNGAVFPGGVYTPASAPAEDGNPGFGGGGGCFVRSMLPADGKM